MKQVYTHVFLVLLSAFLIGEKANAQVNVTITSFNDVLCNGGNDGSATASASGGTGPYSYSWAPSGGTNATAGGLVAGVYTVTATDATLASATATIAITQPTLLSISTSSVPATCGFPNGSASGSPSGGTPPYTYSWAPSGATSATATNLASGSYTITVTDSHGCVVTGVVAVPNYPAPISNAGPDQNICPGGTTVLSGSLSGGSPPYTYSWSGPSGFFSNLLSPSVSPATTSTYTFTVTDSNGCSSSDVVTVFIAPLLNLTFNSSPATCSQTNGMISVTPSGGVSPYTFLWGNNSTNDTLFNVSAGLYSVTVTDAGGCSNSGQGAVSNATGPVITLSGVTNPSCYGSTNGSATANVTGNAPPYSYSWNTQPVQTTPTAGALPSGTYFCTVTDTNNCQSSVSVTLVQPPQLYLGVQQLAPANGNSSGSANAWAGGGNPPYTFAWSNSMSGDTITGLTSGAYSVTVTDNSGCTSQGSVFVANINATIVTGRIYADINSNCVFDAGDMPIANQYVPFYPAQVYAMSDSSGMYTAYVTTTGTQTEYSNFNWMSPYTTGFCPATSTRVISIPALYDTIPGMDFARQDSANVQDLRVSLSFYQAPRAGFLQTAAIYYQNVGTVPVSNTTVNFVFDSILTYVSSSAPPSVNQPAYLEWNTGTLQPGESHMLLATLQVPTIQNGGWIGRPLFYSAAINPNASDVTPVDNGDDAFSHIIASYDPNEKTCYAAGMDSLGNILPSDSVLSYTIHFQNTGTDTAFNIYVIDTLSPYLDPVTVIPGASSHPYSFEMYGNGVMRFDFYNILLPDSNHDSEGSNGFVKYRVKVRPNTAPGSTIDNTGYIYFDFNPAVVTNTTSNTIWNNVPTAVHENSTSGISAFPNPFDESTTIVLPQQYAGKQNQLVITDAAGRVVRSESFTTSSYTFARNTLDSGMYFLTVYSDGKKTGVTKIVVQ
ncbi:MAG TPA: T9SS type A sorting domain-containing protein [Bacteroidia bacterium]|nr:T9SS type A sorting domain-containing protein [Bacteroidia bacterium]